MSTIGTVEDTTISNLISKMNQLMLTACVAEHTHNDRKLTLVKNSFHLFVRLLD